MSKYQVLSTLQKEIKRVNQAIDYKIVRGMSYNREARIHKSLLSQMNRVRSRTFRGTLGFLL